MRSQSENYNAFPDARNVDFSIRFEFIDNTAEAAAVGSSSDADTISDLTQLGDKVTTLGEKYPCLEPELWALDGTCKTLPEDTGTIQTGFWSERMSGVDGVFATPPALTFYFGGAAVSTIGYTMWFDDKLNQYPTSIRITTYAADGITVITQETLSNGGVFAPLEMPSDDYYYVKFEFLATSEPYRRVRLLDLLFGIVSIFDKDSLVDVTLRYGADIAAEYLMSRELEFTFDNTSQKYNLLSPNSLYAYLQDGQNIIAKCIIGGETVEMGTFYYTRAEASDEAMTARMVANDLILSLDEPQYTGGATGTDTLSNVVSAVLAGTGITANYAGTLGSTTVSRAIPADTTKREALRLLAQAACCTCWIDRDGVLQFADLTVGAPVDTLTGDELHDYSGVSVTDKVDAVILVVEDKFAETKNTYTAGTGKNVKTINNPCVTSGNAVAAWLLSCYARRKRYNVRNRCNPAVEVGDTITIYDAYDINADAAVTGMDITYDGGLIATTKAVG